MASPSTTGGGGSTSHGEHRWLAELPVARFEWIALGAEGVRLRELGWRVIAGQEEWPVRDHQQIGLLEPVDAGLIAGLRVVDGDQLATVQIEYGLGERFVAKESPHAAEHGPSVGFGDQAQPGHAEASGGGV